MRKGTIKKIHPPKPSRNGDDVFIRVEFELETGEWAITDLVPSYRNFKRWKPLLKKGTIVEGLQILDERFGELLRVDADSYPREWESEDQKMKKLAKLGVFG